MAGLSQISRMAAELSRLDNNSTQTRHQIIGKHFKWPEKDVVDMGISETQARNMFIPHEN